MLKREIETERVLSWAYQNSCSLADDAINEYCAKRGLLWKTDPMYNYVTFVPKTGGRS